MNENELCTYYDLDKTPGIKVRGKFNSNKFAYLDDAATIQKLVQFNSETQTNITFSLPQMHCSSCVFLLENLRRIDGGIIKSQTNFPRKEVLIIFDPLLISLRKVVELLAFIGYEPDISLKDSNQKRTSTFNRKQLYKLGVAGFCFANIMMLSFPEYFSSGHIEQSGLKETFLWLNLFLSLPVLFFSASGFFISAWNGLRQRFLNIDAPIALAIVVAFGRSYYEIITGKGAGFLDSGTGIVFFMLIGRWFQNKTYDSLLFDRDYQSYFPLGVTVIKNKVEINIPVTNLKKGDRIIIRNEEVIPADAILLKGDALIDYSFVSGENTSVQKKSGDLLYAGGKQLGTAIELEVVNEVSQSYITELWNNDIFLTPKNTMRSFIHPWSRYFTLGLFSIAIAAIIFWWVKNPANIFPVLTSVLLVACPCSLLLSATFTYGNMLRIFGRNKLYLKNGNVIETLASIDTIVFDKTGTITQCFPGSVSYHGTPLSQTEKSAIKNVALQSSHPLSKVIATYLSILEERGLSVERFDEQPGKGVAALVNNVPIKMGSAAFLGENNSLDDTGSNVHISFNDVLRGHFGVSHHYRPGLPTMVGRLKEMNYDLHVLSGDNAREKKNLQRLFGEEVTLRFHQSPQEKLNYIKALQQRNKKVLMLGDGLNDAGALMQSDAGIAVTDNTNRFTPACDAILDGVSVKHMHNFLKFAKTGKKIVSASFVLSILYNVVGLSFAVSARLSPMIAAILMPVSSISIILFVTFMSNIGARNKGL